MALAAPLRRLAGKSSRPGLWRRIRELQGHLARVTGEADETRRRLEHLVTVNENLSAALTVLEHRARELEATRRRLQDEAERDWLTGLHNRRYLERELDELERTGLSGPVSIAILDIDNFKTINDRFGHACGDQVLVQFARALQCLCRPGDIAVRSGGEEFVLMLPETDTAAAVARCERIRAGMPTQTWSEVARELTVTVSIGVGSTAERTQLRSIIDAADHSLYEAKRSGRNRVIAA